MNVRKNLTIGLLMISALLGAQTSGYFSLWGSAGYVQMFHDIPQVQDLPKVYSINGAGGALGLGYEFHHKSFIATTGAEFSYWNTGTKTDDFIILADMEDSEGDDYIGVFELNDNKDRYQVGYVNIPLLVGFQTAKKRFYVLGGAKFGLNVWGQSNVKSNVISFGDYERYIEIFRDMPNHGFLGEERTATRPVSFSSNLALSLELGTYLRIGENPTNDKLYRIALFADYGLLNIHTSKVEGIQYVNTANGLDFRPRNNALLLSERASKKNILPLYAGVKFTILFKLHESSICNCEWY